MITKEKLDKRIRKNKKVTVYSQTNIPLAISKDYHIYRTDPAPELEFDMDCKDLVSFCGMTGLSLTPTHNN